MKNYVGAGVLLATLIGSSNAADIARDVAAGGTSANNDDGGYLELGGSITLSNMIYEQKDRDDNNGVELEIVGFAGGSYRFMGMFVEAELGSYDGLNLGYTLWSNSRWSIDFLAVSAQGTLSVEDDDEDDDPQTEKQRNNEMVDRDTFYNGAGVRVTGYFDNYIMQYRLVTDSHGGNGVTSTLRLGKHWQVRNWNFHGLVGAKYSSARTNDYFYGVDENEATQRFTAYKPEDSIALSAEIGLAYPIRENWVLRSGFRVTEVPTTVSNSPLITNDIDAQITTSMTYVF